MVSLVFLPRVHLDNRILISNPFFVEIVIVWEFWILGLAQIKNWDIEHNSDLNWNLLKGCGHKIPTCQIKQDADNQWSENIIGHISWRVLAEDGKHQWLGT